MKLISCSLYNSWDTLKREASAVLGDEKRKRSVSFSKIPPEHYTLESLAKLINGLFSKYNYHQLEAQINTREAMLQIKIFGAKPITLDRDLANIFGINRALKLITNASDTHQHTLFTVIWSTKIITFLATKSQISWLNSSKRQGLWKSKLFCFSAAAYWRLFDKFSCK